MFKQTQKLNYESIISQLEDKIIQLEKQLKTYQLKIKELEKRPPESYEIQKLNESACRVPKMSRNNSGRDLSQNRKGRYSHTKNLSGNQQNPLKRSLSNFVSQQTSKQQDLFRIQKSFLIHYILQGEEKDQKLIHVLESETSADPEAMAELKVSLKSYEKFMDQFIKQLKQPSLQLQSKLKQHREIIKIQQLIIEQLNGQLNEYQDLFSVMNGSLEEIFYKQTDPTTFDEMRFSIMTTANSFAKNDTLFEQFRQTIDQTHQSTVNKLKQHKSFLKQKIASMETQNKQLKRILDDMIKLIKNNKKLQIASFGSIKQPKTMDDFEPPKQKSKSQMIYRK